MRAQRRRHGLDSAAWRQQDAATPGPGKIGGVQVSVILLFDVHCFSPFDGPIGEFGKSAPDATQHAVVLAAVKDAARR